MKQLSVEKSENTKSALCPICLIGVNAAVDLSLTMCGGGKCQQKYLVKCPAVFTAGPLTQTGMMPLLIARRP